MGKRIHESQLVIEPANAPTIRCDGIGPIRIKDGKVVVTLWSEQISKEGHSVDRVVRAHLVAPIDKALSNLAAVTREMAKMAVGVH